MVLAILIFFSLTFAVDDLKAASQVEIVSSSQKEIRQVINANMGKVKNCYMKKYYSGVKSSIKVSLAITTSGWGSVSAVKLIEVAHSQKKRSPKPFLRCLILSIYDWQFPITGAKSRRFVQDFHVGS